jgi:hypothetical protein
MTNKLCEVKRDGKILLLDVYHDFHRYATIYTVTFIYRYKYTLNIERNFKSFPSACKYFNKLCEKYGLSDCVIW